MIGKGPIWAFSQNADMSNEKKVIIFLLNFSRFLMFNLIALSHMVSNNNNWMIKVPYRKIKNHIEIDTDEKFIVKNLLEGTRQKIYATVYLKHRILLIILKCIRSVICPVFRS